MANRPKIKESLRQMLLYESAFVCVVCQARRVQIHHIDEDSGNNEPNNLVVICHACHDDAHAKKSLSQNLTPTRLRVFKKNWIGVVKARREAVATLSGQLSDADEWSGIGVTWGYINFARVAQLIDTKIIQAVDRNILHRCQAGGFVDMSGIFVQPAAWQPSKHFTRNTIYDRVPFGDDHALHKLYTEFVDQIVLRVTPTHLTRPSWTKKFIENCVQEGQFVFFTKAQYFKVDSEDQENAHIRVKTTLNKIACRYFIDTKYMLGTTSITESFSGHKTCSSLVQVKSIDKSKEQWTLDCTPIALGVGFRIFT
jgi:hypothetical protein